MVRTLGDAAWMRKGLGRWERLDGQGYGVFGKGLGRLEVGLRTKKV
jgi:hypothetical protein